METKPTLQPKPVPRKNRLLRAILKPLILLLLCFLVLEIGIHLTYAIRNARVQAVPLPYVIGHDYGPLPPWLSDLMILAPDKDLIWRSRPNLRRRYVDIFSPVANEAERRSLLRRFGPSLPEAWKDNPSWEIVLNADGFRTDAPRTDEPACRIICLGDSWTFGMNVGEEQTYPRRVEARLREAVPQGDIEVVNLGVLGYSSYQGLELLKKKAPELNPDIVLIGFGMNDAKVNEVGGVAKSDWDVAAYEKNPTFGDRAVRPVVRLLKRSETFNLLAYLAQLATYEQKTLDIYLKDEADEGEVDDEPVPPPSATPAKGEERKEEQLADPYDWLKYARVPPADYEQNIRAMVRLARGHGARVVLLYNELWLDGPYQKALEKVAASENVPLVNGSALIAEARRKVEQDLERQLGLVPPDAGIVREKGVEVVFRVYLGDRPVPRGVFITGPHPMLGDCVPNKVALYDDGTHGDQKAGDGVWSYTATFRAGANVHYVYTNSGREGQWEGLDVPHIREFKMEPKEKGKRVYLPVETFGKIYMQADGWHPNAEGYDLIAQAVCEVLKQDEKVKASVRR